MSCFGFGALKCCRCAAAVAGTATQLPGETDHQSAAPTACDGHKLRNVHSNHFISKMYTANIPSKARKKKVASFVASCF